MGGANLRKRIAALVATPSKRNTGMRIVNDALVRWIDSQGLLAETDFFQFEAAPEFPEAPRYGCVLELVPERYERVVVWGDFIVDRNWLAKACERVARERAAAVSDVQRHVDAVIFGGADGAPSPQRIVAGQCFLVSDDAYDADRAYQARFARLAREAKPFLLRDPLSVARASVFSGAPASALPPLDTALLRPALCARAGAHDDGDARARDGFGLFFGRTEGGFGAKLGATLAARSSAAGRARYLRWLPAKPVPAWVRIAANPVIDPLPGALDEIADVLRRLSFVVTDTYHLALVCWSLGVPAICVGAGAQRFAHSVHDKKKELFFLSQRIERFHLFAEEGFAAAHAQTRAMLAEIAGADPAPRVAAQIRAQAERVLGALDAALRGR
jgi:hypothetical protein